jgi:hypothetical protein
VKTLLSGGGQIGVSVSGPVLTVAFQQPRSGFTMEVLVHTSQMIDVRFASADVSWRIQANATPGGQLQTKTFQEH